MLQMPERFCVQTAALADFGLKMAVWSWALNSAGTPPAQADTRPFPVQPEVIKVPRRSLQPRKLGGRVVRWHEHGWGSQDVWRQRSGRRSGPSGPVLTQACHSATAQHQLAGWVNRQQTASLRPLLGGRAPHQMAKHPSVSSGKPPGPRSPRLSPK